MAEDDDLVRGLATHVLRRNGYEVLEAASGEEALALADRHAGPDPAAGQRRGHAAHERAGAGGTACASSVPSCAVLLMSGHPPDALLDHGVDNPDEALLEKPFGAGTLLERVRLMLDRAAA